MGTEEHHGPLTTLAAMLVRAWPPRLSTVAAAMDVGGLADFIRLVKDFLPDREAEIMNVGNPPNMVSAFALAFKERYFPLDERVERGDVENFHDLVDYIPLTVWGFSYDDYHEIPDMRRGIVIASLLVNFEGWLGWEGGGIRITAMEAAQEFVPVAVLERIPEQGYSLDFLRETLPGSPYVGLLRIAGSLCQDTGNVFLDAGMEDICDGLTPWDRETVDHLTLEWHEAEGMEKELMSYLDWIEETTEARLLEILDFLERGKDGAPVALGHIGQDEDQA